jgi:acyl-CoA synthetase
VVATHTLAASWVDEDIRREFEANGYWTSQTWLDSFLAGHRHAPAGLCVADETAEMTRADVLTAARRLAGYMAARGVRSGDVVTVVVPNWWEFVVIHAAIALLGGVVNPALPRLGVSEYRHILQAANTRMVFAAKSHYRGSPLELVKAAAHDAAALIDIVAVRSEDPADRPILAGILCKPADRTPFEPGRPQLPADARSWDTVSFTSGTEALPKGVVHTHQSAMFGLRTYAGAVLGLSETDCVFMPSPVCHASGLQWGLRAATYARAPLILQDRWNPEVALGLIDKYRCTYTLVATPFIVDLVKARRQGVGDGRSLRYLACGGATIPRHLVGDVRTTFGATLMSVFGASETYVATCTRPQDSDEQLATDGLALPGVEVAIVDEDGVQVPPGIEGEITCRGPNVFLGYLGEPALTRRAFRGPWYRFGDLGTMDSSGRIRVTGRIKDIVIRGGENISVREIEEMLASHPAVAAVAVVGYPDDRLGERCCAVVVPPDGVTAPTLDAVCDFLRGRGLPTFKLPERLEIVSRLPMTVTGKVKKAELREFVSARVGNGGASASALEGL